MYTHYIQPFWLQLLLRSAAPRRPAPRGLAGRHGTGPGWRTAGRPGQTRRPGQPGWWTAERPGRTARWPICTGTRKGTNEVSTNGVTANFMFFDRGPFGVLPLTYFEIPKSASAYLFPQSDKIDYFCSGLISVDPICPQPRYLLGAHSPPGALAKTQSEVL